MKESSLDAIASTNSRANQQAQEWLVKAHAVLVKRIAHHLLVRLPHSVMLDDLIQAGMMGLLEAARHYDVTKGASFETYAGIRIRGYILDEVRRNDWIPRSVHRNSRLVSAAVKAVENRLGREASDREIAEELHLEVDEYYELLKEASGSQFYGFDDSGLTDDTMKDDNHGLSEPQASAMHDDTMEKLTEIIHHLPKKERLVLSLYYEQDLNLKEIGEVLGVSESRISQIHTQATLRLKARFPEK